MLKSYLLGTRKPLLIILLAVSGGILAGCANVQPPNMFVDHVSQPDYTKPFDWGIAAERY